MIRIIKRGFDVVMFGKSWLEKKEWQEKWMYKGWNKCLSYLQFAVDLTEEILLKIDRSLAIHLELHDLSVLHYLHDLMEDSNQH